MLVSKLFQKSDVLVIVRIPIAVTTRTADPLQRINDNELCGWMLRLKLLDLLFQPVP